LDALDADWWSDDVRLSDTEPLFTCQASGKKGADVRPNFHWEERDPTHGEFQDGARRIPNQARWPKFGMAESYIGELRGKNPHA
jgi:hypothetical protein